MSVLVHDLVIAALIGGPVVVLGLVAWLAYRSHVKQRDVKRTNDRLNQGH